MASTGLRTGASTARRSDLGARAGAAAGGVAWAEIAVAKASMFPPHEPRGEGVDTIAPRVSSLPPKGSAHRLLPVPASSQTEFQRARSNDNPRGVGRGIQTQLTGAVPRCDRRCRRGCGCIGLRRFEIPTVTRKSRRGKTRADYRRDDPSHRARRTANGDTMARLLLSTVAIKRAHMKDFAARHQGRVRRRKASTFCPRSPEARGPGLSLPPHSPPAGRSPPAVDCTTAHS